MRDTDMTEAQAKLIDAQIAQLMADTAKLTNEGRYIAMQAMVTPFLAAAAVIGATAAVVKIFF